MKTANDSLRFLLELAVLAAVAYWGYRATTSSLRWLLMITIPTLIGAVWATWVAAESSSALADPWRLLLEIAIFGAGAGALAWAGRARLAITFAALAITHLSLTFVLDQRTTAA